MKSVLAFFVVCSCLVLTSCLQKPVSSAIIQIVQNFYENRSQEFDIIFCGNGSYNLNEIVDEVGKEISLPYKVIAWNVTSRYFGKDFLVHLNRSVVFVFDTWVTYFKFYLSTMLNNVYSKDFYFLVYVDEFLSNERAATDFSLLVKFFHYQSFLLRSIDGLLSLSTWITFQQPHCRIWKLIELNRFSDKLKKWSTETFFVEKFDTFNGCKLTVSAPYPQTNILQIDFNEQGNLTNVRGYGHVFNHEISKSLNYSYVYLPFDLRRNNSLIAFDFAIKAESFRRIQFGNYGLNQRIKYEYPFVTDRYTTIDEIILISRFEPYSQFEKIFIPFEIEIWHWLIVVMSIAVFVIRVLKSFASERVRAFVIGSKVQSPMLNFM